MDPIREHKLLLTRRHFFGRMTTGVGVAALGSLLNPVVFDALAHANGVGQFGLVKFFQARLVIEQFHLRRSPRHEQVDQAPGAGRELRRPEPSFRSVRFIAQRLEKAGIQQRTQRGDTDAGGHAAKEMATGEEQAAFVNRVHSR